ncbi:Bifunctional sulfatase/alpha-L-rhamnosidase [subsurface metagenome]
MRTSIIQVIILMLLVSACVNKSYNPETERPNILFIIADDMSWEHAGCYGDQAVRTPAIDKLAAEGVRFEHAYTAAPSCSPSRAGILTGQNVYRLKEGGVLTGFIRDEFVLFPKLLEENGYVVGSTGKRYAPRTRNVVGAIDEPLGKIYDKHRFDSAPEGISRNNYSENFRQFIEENEDNEPFFFWVGITEPHIRYEIDRGVRTGIDTSKIRVPGFLPDVSVTRLNMADYLSEIEWADNAVGEMIDILESKGLKNNTLIIYTSDNGMPLPRSKATLYDHGVRMPLVIRWGDQVKGKRVVTDPVSLTDMAPTFLDLAGIEIPDQMTGRSIKNLLFSDKSGDIDKEREFVVTTFEKHIKRQMALP